MTIYNTNCQLKATKKLLALSMIPNITHKMNSKLNASSFLCKYQNIQCKVVHKDFWHKNKYATQSKSSTLQLESLATQSRLILP